MVARRSSSKTADLSNEDALRRALAEREAEVEALRSELAGFVSAGEEFLSDAAHAIRSPLTITHSYLEIIRTDLSEGLTEEQQAFIGIAFENADRLRKLVDDVVDLAALEVGAAQIDSAPTALDQIVNSVCAELQSTIDRHGLVLNIEVSANLPTVTIDEARMTDVLRRLIANSIFFTPEGGSINLRAKHERDNLIVEVRDTGPGIPADRINEVWRAFSQLHRKPGEKREGYGLGLPLSRRMVEAMGGSLELTSVEGEGTTITIKVPVAGSK